MRLGALFTAVLIALCAASCDGDDAHTDDTTGDGAIDVTQGKQDVTDISPEDTITVTVTTQAELDALAQHEYAHLIIGVDAYGEDGSITDIGALAYLPNLVYAGLDRMAISDLSPLAGLKKLSSLYLRYNNIEDISALAGLDAMTTLRLDGNRIENIEALRGLTKLETLGLGNNKISNIEPLCGLTKLDEL